MDKYKIEHLSNIYFNKITKWYGSSKHHVSTPYVLIEDSPYSDADDPELIAEYKFSENEIIIYWKNVNSIELLIRSLIHEYQHYLQSKSWFTRYYDMGYNYVTHPYEINARNSEENWKYFYEK